MRHDMIFPGGSPDFLVVGLGNPGNEYSATRHNVGFMAVDSLAERLGLKIDRLRCNALTVKCNIGGKCGFLMKPQTFMNNSGISVAQAARYYNIPSSRVVVLYDDTALPVGALRIRSSGSAGGHNGMKSVIDHLGSDRFPRVRFGIGAKPQGWDLADYVLGKLPPGDKNAIVERFADLEQIISCILNGQTEFAMADYNYNPPRKPKDPDETDT